MDSKILFCDIEASGLGTLSYPIEIAVAEFRGETHHWLIDPSSIAGWTHWDRSAERVHGLSRFEVQDWGLPAEQVASELRALIEGQALISDNPGADRRWLDRLFIDADCALPQYEVIDAFDLFKRRLNRVSIDRHERDERLFNLRQWSRAMHIPHHRAKPDAQYLRRLYGLIEQAVSPASSVSRV